MESLKRDLPMWGLSVALNLAVLIPLHFIVREHQQESELAEIESVLEDLDEQNYQFSTTMMDQVGSTGDQLSSTATGSGSAAAVAVTSPIGRVQASPAQQVEQAINPQIQPFDLPMAAPGQMAISSMIESSGPATENVTGGGVEGAVDRLTFELASALHERQTLAIWLFDASQSQNDRRAKIAERFENVYRQLELMGATKGEKGDADGYEIEGLYTAVASFQDKTTLITPQPVDDVKEIVQAVRDIKPDPATPKENVFSAVKLVTGKFDTFRRNDGRWNKLIFIVTDEKGENEDAVANLEEVINYAKRMQFRVYVVGNAAVFGQEKGFVDWKYDDGFVGQVAVDQGPETAFPMVLQLPFWGSGDVRMSAAYGPYALTRLTAETGGMYLITDDTAAVKYEPARMREYAPEYLPIRALESEWRKHPAKAALVETARQTYQDIGQLALPTLLFNGENDNILRNEITEAQKRPATARFWVERMLTTLRQGAQARDSLVEPRWRASYDLAMGRLLATNVRLVGYDTMLAQMKSTPKTFQKTGYNEWRLVPAKEVEAGPKVRKDSDEARKLLKRVIDEHPGTPWETMAVKELGQDFGWAWEEGIHYTPGLENMAGVDEEQVRLLLAEEERRRERQQMQSVQRPTPNL